MVETLPQRGMLRVVSPDGVTQSVDAQDRAAAAAENPGQGNDAQVMTELAAYIRRQFEMMKNHRNSASGWNERLLSAQRVFIGEYDAQKIREIRQFGGSEVYARIIAAKCRGASALLREVYLGSEKPWGLDATPDPVLPEGVTNAVQQLLQVEVQGLQQAGQPIDPGKIRDRANSLMDAAQRAGKKKAKQEAKKAENKLDDLLVEGGLYKALAEFIVDLPLFPFAVLKGPIVRIVPDVVWEGGKATTKNRPKMFWGRVSPFDLYWTPGVSDVEDADVIERIRYTRADLNDVLGLPGYNEDAVRQVLQDYGKGGLRDWLDSTDTERAVNEGRESPTQNSSGLIDGLEFHGSVQGTMLLDWGMDTAMVPDPDRDYFVQAWLIGRHVIKVQLSPSPRKRHPYYVTSFEKVPGTVVGNALPDILADVQDVGNATLRSLVNNLSISSGPQVVINADRLANGETGQQLYPWKRWFVSNDPMQTNAQAQQPVYFFQPQSNAQELLAVYEKFTQIADELSAIPRYITGSDRMGGAGRTASGLAMLMGNASKILQTVAANIDRDVLTPCLTGLYDLVMLTDQSGMFRGDEAIRVRGVDVAVQRETERARQIEFLQATANPMDAQIMGVQGRAKVLRAVSTDLGLDGDDIIPSEEELKAQMEAAQLAQQQQAQLTQQGNSGDPTKPGQAPPAKPGSTAPGVQESQNMKGIES